MQETKLKTNNAYRTILVDRDILNMLLTMKEERKIESDYVFCSPTGGILEPGSQRKRLQRLLESCGMEKIRFHDLRHTFATLALQNGVDVKTRSGPAWAVFRRVHPGYLRPHLHPDEAGRGSEGRRIPANEYVMYRQTA